MSFTKMIYPVAAQEELVEDYFGTKVKKYRYKFTFLTF